MTHKDLLEWETAAATEHRLGTGIGNFIRSMWPSPAFAAGVGLLVAYVRPGALPAALAGPAGLVRLAPRRLLDQPTEACGRVAADRPRAGRASADRAEDLALLRDLRRRRGQLAPARQLPGRLDRLGRPGRAPDLADEQGDAPPLDPRRARLRLPRAGRPCSRRLENTFDTFDRMEKHEGHLYNWYNTQTLRTLPPNYVSTVDSGNLLGCLVTLKQGMIEKAHEPIPSTAARDGLVDTLAVLVEDIRSTRPAKAGEEYKAFDASAREVSKYLATPPGDLAEWHHALEFLAEAAATMIARELVRSLHRRRPDGRRAVGWLRPPVRRPDRGTPGRDRHACPLDRGHQPGRRWGRGLPRPLPNTSRSFGDAIRRAGRAGQPGRANTPGFRGGGEVLRPRGHGPGRRSSTTRPSSIFAPSPTPAGPRPQWSRPRPPRCEYLAEPRRSGWPPGWTSSSSTRTTATCFRSG